MTAESTTQPGTLGYVDAAVMARARALLPLVRRELGAGEEHAHVLAVAIERAKGEAA